MNDEVELSKKHAEWNESYYFNFYDKTNDLTVFMRIGNKVNKDEKMMFFYIMSPQLLAGVKLETPCDDAPLKIAGLEFQEILTGKWKLTYDGTIYNPLEKTDFEVNMDVTWQSLNPVMDYKDCVDEKQTEMSSKVASEHFEQFGKATGEIRIDDKVYAIDALGERDQSIGIRAWESPKMWMWINSAFSDIEAFNITKLSVEEGEVDAGYFHTQGANNPLIKSEIKVKYEKAIPTNFIMKLEDKKGTVYPVSGEVVRYGLIPVDERMNLIETLSRYTWNGKEGYGIAEFLIPKTV